MPETSCYNRKQENYERLQGSCKKDLRNQCKWPLIAQRWDNVNTEKIILQWIKTHQTY